jgi:hypothetical protein
MEFPPVLGRAMRAAASARDWELSVLTESSPGGGRSTERLKTGAGHFDLYGTSWARRVLRPTVLRSTYAARRR